MHTTTFASPALVPALILGLAVAACDDATVTVPDASRILTIEIGADLQVSDTAVAVDGTPRVGISSPSQGLAIYHATAFEYGGLGNYAPDRVRDEQWFSRFRYQLDPVERGDTVVFEYLDFGDVAMEVETLLKAEDPPDATGAPFPVEFVNFVIYAGTHLAWRRELNGAAITLVESPFLERMRRGDDIGFSGTGGPRTAAFQATFSIRPLPALVGMDNGRDLAFRTDRPIIDADRDLGLSFDGVVDPETAVFALIPWHEDIPDARRRAATLVGGLPAGARRVIIPAQVLRQLLDAAGVDEAGYILYVIRGRDTGDVIPVHRLDTDTHLELGVGQMDEIRVLVRLVR